MQNVWGNLFYPRAAVVCFGEMLFVVSLENSLQFYSCIFSSLVVFVFETDLHYFFFFFSFSPFPCFALSWILSARCVELWITIAAELNIGRRNISNCKYTVECCNEEYGCASYSWVHSAHCMLNDDCNWLVCLD